MSQTAVQRPPVERGLPMPDVEGVEHRFADVRGVRIHYAEAGEGEPIVLVHGWPQHWWCWRELIGPLAEHHRVICPDIRGIGWSQGSSRGYRLDELAADVLGLMDALGLERVRLVTHDWGTALGYRAALYWPRRIERFVPLAGVPPWAAEAVPLSWWRRVWHIYVNATIGRYAGPDLFGIPERVLRTWRHVGAFTPDEARTYLAPLRRRESVNATHRFYNGIVFYEIPRAFRNYQRWRMRVPTLHLNGEHDSLTKGMPDNWRYYTDDMRYEEIPDCGHFMAEERPQELLDRITEFLA